MKNQAINVVRSFFIVKGLLNSHLIFSMHVHLAGLRLIQPEQPGI
ncbi:MAG: hypothetical protein JWQ27_1943 [Ferruginibacter sp.]|nr:hypothetical protein [Ferruginibacter sp.]